MTYRTGHLIRVKSPSLLRLLIGRLRRVRPRRHLLLSWHRWVPHLGAPGLRPVHELTLTQRGRHVRQVLSVHRLQRSARVLPLSSDLHPRHLARQLTRGRRIVRGICLVRSHSLAGHVRSHSLVGTHSLVGHVRTHSRWHGWHSGMGHAWRWHSRRPGWYHSGILWGFRLELFGVCLELRRWTEVVYSGRVHYWRSG